MEIFVLYYLNKRRNRQSTLSLRGFEEAVAISGKSDSVKRWLVGSYDWFPEIATALTGLAMT